jgi:hypothetical protein
MIAVAIVATVELTQNDSGDYRRHISVGTVSIIAVALIWLPNAMRVLVVVGGTIKAGGVEATTGGLLNSPDDLVGDLASLRTKTENIAVRQPNFAPSVSTVNSAIDGIASKYLPPDRLLTTQLLGQKARQYERLRQTMSSSAARTNAMATLVNDVSIRATAAPVPARMYVGQLLRSAKEGDRIVGLGLAQGAPSSADLVDILHIFNTSMSAFEQFHSLKALRLLAPALSAEQRTHVIQALQGEKLDPRGVGVMKDPNIPSQIERTLNALSGNN